MFDINVTFNNDIQYLMIDADDAISCAKKVSGDIVLESDKKENAFNCEELEERELVELIYEKVNQCLSDSDWYIYASKNLKQFCEICKDSAYLSSQIDKYEKLTKRYYALLTMSCLVSIGNYKGITKDKNINQFLEEAEITRKQANNTVLHMMKYYRTHRVFNVSNCVDNISYYYNTMYDDKPIPIDCDIKKEWVNENYWIALKNYIRPIVEIELCILSYANGENTEVCKSMALVNCINTVNVFFEANKDNPFINIQQNWPKSDGVSNFDEIKKAELYRFNYVQSTVEEIIKKTIFTPLANGDEYKNRILTKFSEYRDTLNSIR